MKKLAKELQDKKLESHCYLFYGEEKYLIDLYEDRMRGYLESAGDPSMNMDTFWGKSANVQDIFDALETLPFLSDFRLVIVKNSGLFAAGRKNDSAIAAERLKDIPETGVVVFIEENVDKRGAAYKAVVKAGRAIEFSRPSEGELAAWITREFKALGIAIDKPAAIYLTRIVGGGMEQMSQEIKKLTAYCSEKAAVTRQDMDDICTKSLELRVFTMVDAVAGKNAGKALEIFENLIEAKESPIMVLNLVARQFRLILQCAGMKGLPAGEIAAAIGAPPFVVRECIKQGENFDESTLVEAIKDCLQADIGIKTGKIADRTALETLIVKYAS